MQRYSNVSSVPLSMAVFLATDYYDYVDDPYHISATSLIKPIRQLILGNRVSKEGNFVDLTQMVASRMGAAIHDSIERAWTTNYAGALEQLGYPKKVIEKVRVNPKPEELQEDHIPIYLEQRSHKKIGKWTVSGKFDFVGDGRVEDFKSTSVYTAINHSNDAKYIMQGSIYRWLNPTLITRPEMAIQFIFTDWSGAKAKSDPAYPQSRIQQRIFPLKPVQEIEHYVRNRLTELEKYMNAPEEAIPPCSNEDLWRSEPVFKYYKNPAKLSRSTKNFDNKQDAYLRLSEDGNVGIVKEVPGQVMACKYCSAFPICTQKDALIASGDLLVGN